MTEVDSLEVSSGVLDLDNRNYVELDGIADYIEANTALQAEMRTSFSWSAWVRVDDGVTAANQTILGSRNDGTDRLNLYVATDGRLSLDYVSNNDSKSAIDNSVTFANGVNAWKQVVATLSYTDSSNAVMKLYVNGEALTLDGTNNGAFSGNMGNYTTSTEYYFGAENNNGSARYFLNGGMRDVIFYDYALSADQVASLYRGSYNVTPLHWWKLNEGTGATASIEDYGIGTDSDGTGVSLTWAGTDNFKINGSARIGTNGSI
jgi:hypothetical protein